MDQQFVKIEESAEPPTRIVDVTFGMNDYTDIKYLSNINLLDKRVNLELKRATKDPKHSDKYQKGVA